MVEQHPFKVMVGGSNPPGLTKKFLAEFFSANIAGSSKGRTQDFGSWYRGSNPCPAAIRLTLSEIERVRSWPSAP